jgi:RND family efflux transporter MFP subunit
VRKGDRVKQGQELAHLESVQQEQALIGVKAALEAAQADLFQAKEEFERQDRFLERGATTRIRRDEAERRYRISQANVERAEAELRRAQKTFDDTFLYASTDGTVIERMADPGEVVTGAHPILELAQGEAVDAVFDAPEALPVAGLEIDLNKIAIDLVLIDKPEVRFTGSVRKVSPLVDPRKGTVEVSIGVDQPPQETLYGDAVRGIFVVTGPRRIILPYSALTAVDQGPAVWVVDPDTMTVSLQPITIARYTDNRIVTEGGVEPGARIVTSAVQLLYPGRIVRLKEND